MKLSLIMPVYNESRTLKTIIDRVLAVPQVSQLIIVDDHSSDSTPSIIKKYTNKRIKVIRHSRNQGKGAAIRSGLHVVTGDHVLIQDADLEYDPQEIVNLVKPITEGKAEVVFGSRFLGPHTQMFYWHYIGNKFLNWVVNILFNSTLTDMETCYKLVPTHLLVEMALIESDFRIEPEITCSLLKKGVHIYEVPISFAARTYAEGKKISWRDGIFALLTIMRIRLT